MPLSPKPDGASSVGFEAAYAELQRVVAELESSNVDLDRAVELLERGNELVIECERIVAAAELRVTRLAAESPFAAAESSQSDAP
jgi:exodeoxyribonuclease VII small subunit